MLSRILIISIVLLSSFACSDPDPCVDNPNALECITGDFDGDGIVNGEDSDPSDACVPNKPSFEMIVIGTWDYVFGGSPGIIKINADGSYEDLEGEIASDGVVTSKTWRIEDEKFILIADGTDTRLTWINYDCTSFTLDGQGVIPNVVFTRV